MSWHVISAVYKAKLGSPTRKAIAAKLADWADDDGGSIFPSVQRIADETETSVRTIQYVLKRFVAEGLLLVVARGGRGPRSTTEYRLCLNHISTLPRSRIPDAEKGAKIAPLAKKRRVQPATEKGATVAPDLSVNPKTQRQAGITFSEGAGDRLIPFEGMDAGTILAGAKAGHAAGVALLMHKRLPFTADVIARIRRMCVDVEALAERYKSKTRGRRIADPSAYLMRMAQDEVAKRDGVSVEIVARLAAADSSERAAILAKAAGVDVDPAEAERRRRVRATKSDGNALLAALSRMAVARSNSQ